MINWCILENNYNSRTEIADLGAIALIRTSTTNNNGLSGISLIEIDVQSARMIIKKAIKDHERLVHGDEELREGSEE